MTHPTATLTAPHAKTILVQQLTEEVFTATLLLTAPPATLPPSNAESLVEMPTAVRPMIATNVQPNKTAVHPARHATAQDNVSALVLHRLRYAVLMALAPPASLSVR